VHPRLSLPPTDQRENPQAKALYAGAAFTSDVRIDVLKDRESLKREILKLSLIVPDAS